MAKFKEIPQTFKIRKLVEYWYNLVQNLNEECRDSDFFELVSINVPHDQVEALLRIAYTEEEIDALEHASRRTGRLDFSDSAQEMLQAAWNGDGTRDKCRLVCKSLRATILNSLAETSSTEETELRLAELQRVLRLTDFEREIVTFNFIRADTCFCYPRRVEASEQAMFTAMALNRSYEEVLAALSPNGRLRRFNVLDEDYDLNRRTYGGFLAGTEKEPLENRFYRKSDLSDVLPWSFYGELGEGHGRMLRNLLSAAHGKGKLNILLYGAPGTGKTSFARTLAAETGLISYEILQGERNHKDMTPETRLAGIQICGEQIDPEGSLVIVDEADGLLRSGSGIFSMLLGGNAQSTEKGLVNTVLDDMKVPAIWISNISAREMDESVRRRFDYSVCFERLNAVQREAIWGNCIRKFGLEKTIPAEDIPEYAASYNASAGGISMVLENLKRLSPAQYEVRRTIADLMKQHCQLMGTDSVRAFAPAKDYTLDGLNIQGAIKPAHVVEAVRNYLREDGCGDGVDRPRMNLLLWGPPGSGKTEFVKYLGERTGLRVIVKRGSDILNPYVGGTEKNIRAAFMEAEAEHAILFLDEIDGLLHSREGASKSWEVTQVNELLQQMEEFHGVLVAATNFVKNLDTAAIRRFTFKLQFDYLDNEGKRHFFEHMFKTKLLPGEDGALCAIDRLCPGDFRTVRQSLYYLGNNATNAVRLEALRAEAAAKSRDSAKASIGFQVSNRCA